MMQKMTSITPFIYEIVTIFKVLDNPTVSPVHFELFYPSVIRGPWIMLEKYVVEGLTKN